MPNSTVTESVSIGSLAFPKSTVLGGESQEPIQVSLPVAATGTLTTRTDDNTGVITLASGHGLTTGDVVDIYWSGGYRRGMAATVATNALTIDAGAGTVLPIATTAVKVGKVHDVTCPVASSLIQILAAIATGRCVLDFLDGSNASLLAIELEANNSYIWHASSGVTNPIAGTVAKIRISNGISTAVNALKIGLLKNSVASI